MDTESPILRRITDYCREFWFTLKINGAQANTSYNTFKDSDLDDYDIFLVANDKYGLYSKIAELARMKIVNQYKRPVLNRVEKDMSAYAEIIFHLKEK